MRKLFLASLLVLLSLCANAYNFEVDGICYYISDNNLVVTSGGEYTGDIVIPNSVKYDSKEYNVTGISGSAFSGCRSLTSITIPGSVTFIGDNAFRECYGLTSVNLSEGVTSIGNWTFQNCRGLTSMVIPESVTYIGGYAFRGCSALTSIIIPEGVAFIGNYAFCNCGGLTSVTIPGSVTSIGNYIFKGCSGLTSITIPESVTSIGDNAFEGCSGLTSINIPENVTNIGLSAFSGCSGLTSVAVANGNSVYDSRDNCNAIIKKNDNRLIVGCKNTVIPQNVTSIGDNAFRNCSDLTSINIPESVTSIGTLAFANCSDLTSINIPAGVTNIGDWAFFNCNSLGDIYCYGSTPADVLEKTFNESTYSTCTLHVPYGTVDAYKATEWGRFLNIVEFDATGVEAVSVGDKPAAEQCVYSIGGVRMAAPQKGLNIINGRKVVY